MNISLDMVMRCLDIVPIVRENQGITLSELSQRTNLSEAEIVDEIIPTLMLCGAPPYMPHDYVNIWLEGDRVHVGFADHFARPVTLLPIEVTALHVALSTAWFPSEVGESVRDRIQALREKIESALPPEQRVFLEDSERLRVRDTNERESPLLADVQRACERHKKLEIEYLSTGSAAYRQRVVHPYGVVMRDGVAYVMSHDEDRGHVVSFRLDRMRSARVLDEDYEPDPSFSLEDAADRGPAITRREDETIIEVEITGPRARDVAETVESRQWRWTDADTLRLEIATSRPQAAIRWVLSLGPGAVILGPESARAAAVDELGRMRSASEVS